VITYARSAKRQRLYAMRPLADRFQEKVDTHGPTPTHRPDLGSRRLVEIRRGEVRAAEALF
jgi:hypothetical protein